MWPTPDWAGSAWIERPPMLFDTHAHYDDDQFDGDRETLLASLPEQGVGLVVNPGCTVASSRTAVELARRFPHVYAAVGIHPENCGDFRPEDLDAIRALAREDKVVAIGEIGLDYYWPENPPRPLQQQVLRSQLALAQELSLPVIIHDRDAHADTMAIVREFPGLRGVFHCFAGSVEMARELVADAAARAPRSCRHGHGRSRAGKNGWKKSVWHRTPACPGWSGGADAGRRCREGGAAGHSSCPAYIPPGRNHRSTGLPRRSHATSLCRPAWSGPRPAGGACRRKNAPARWPGSR